MGMQWTPALAGGPGEEKNASGYWEYGAPIMERKRKCAYCGGIAEWTAMERAPKKCEFCGAPPK
jgi:hypothetical protein